MGVLDIQLRNLIVHHTRKEVKERSLLFYRYYIILLTLAYISIVNRDKIEYIYYRILLISYSNLSTITYYDIIQITCDKSGICDMFEEREVQQLLGIAGIFTTKLLKKNEKITSFLSNKKSFWKLII